ncbi:uncharacterized protein KY384_009173 [Bacidia gigantensis]|uniref:uncharacterized protein n=1 Tax=Bacidia gigantensis TaxID=2732470 RepID=UPI001D0478D1|nr:uncharacterized protein KY384_009173 [Bacidia gigantensis]KAG8525529.1 hypothetical protein KY384_009173 [Bacidia gigantensis]
MNERSNPEMVSYVIPEDSVVADSKPSPVPKVIALVSAEPDMSDNESRPGATSQGDCIPLVYKLHYKDVVSNELIHTREDKKPIQTWSGKKSARLPTLELITDVYTSAKSSEKEASVADAPLIVNDWSRTYLKINSPAIIRALQSEVDYYPNQDFSGESIQIYEPFTVLVHFEKELASYRERFSPGQVEPESLCDREKSAYEDIEALQSFLGERIGDSVEKERQRHERGFASFEMLWLLLKPGATVYYDKGGSLDAFVIHGVSGGIVNGQSTPYVIDMWYLDYDGESIGRRIHRVVQNVFGGERDITNLKVFPCEPAKSENANNYLQRLEERGKKFCELTSRQCRSYDGLTSTFPRNSVKGLVMVDSEEWNLRAGSDERPVVGGLSDGVPTGIYQCSCTVCLKLKSTAARRKISPFAEYDGITPEKNKVLTSHQYILCSGSITVYELRSLEWRKCGRLVGDRILILLSQLYLTINKLDRVYVAGIDKPQFDRGMIDTLVVREDRRQLVMALAERNTQKADLDGKSQDQRWTADRIEGKGKGTVVLLHGKPGVGKTYTAECIAHYTQRPLLSLTVTDIGTTPEEVEQYLNPLFERAKRWNAILLLDEADIYMEARERLDLARNSLVSGIHSLPEYITITSLTRGSAFLRAMEQCQSLLFLTTNRVGSFDDAFISRIHVSLYYPDFSDEERKKVWKMLFDKLARDRGDIMRVPIDTKDYINGKEVKAVEWNGREITNAIQTAVALADFENDKDEEGKILLKDTHISQIVRMSKQFKTYLKEVHRADESKRAARQNLRQDDFDLQILLAVSKKKGYMLTNRAGRKQKRTDWFLYQFSNKDSARLNCLNKEVIAINADHSSICQLASGDTKCELIGGSIVALAKYIVDMSPSEETSQLNSNPIPRLTVHIAMEGEHDVTATLRSKIKQDQMLELILPIGLTPAILVISFTESPISSISTTDNHSIFS